MGWENRITAYKIVDFKKDDIIPPDAVFIRTYQVADGVYGWASNLKTYYRTVYEYQIPVYKKVRTKKVKAK